MPILVARLVQRGVILVWMHEEAMQQQRNCAKYGKKKLALLFSHHQDLT